MTFRPVLGGIAVIFALSACTGGTLAPEPDIFDPIEPVNRSVHVFNKGVDTIVLRPASQAYGFITPDPAERLVGNAAANLGEPASAVNNLLQGDILASLTTVGRFAVNSTVGLLGLFDPATGVGLMAQPTDFGETLYTWGVGEGPFVEMPLLGPNTARSATGRVVDIVIDPLNTLVPQPERTYITGMKVVEVIDQRKKLSAVVDTTLYQSADSYAAARRAFVDNRRRALKGASDAEDFDDPFAFDE